jgi:hypothetical protein
MNSRRRIGHSSSRVIGSLSRLRMQGNGYVAGAETNKGAACCGALVGFWPTGADSYLRQLGPVIEVDLTQRLRGRDSRVLTLAKGGKLQ